MVGSRTLGDMIGVYTADWPSSAAQGPGGLNLN